MESEREKVEKVRQAFLNLNRDIAEMSVAMGGIGQQVGPGDYGNRGVNSATQGGPGGTGGKR